MEMDVVYILGKGSKWENNEIRYSLRSIEKYLLGFKDIYIIGEYPDFLRNIYHIPYPDLNSNKQKNICDKILRACSEPSISEQFLLMNDDIFLLKPQAITMPYYYDGNLQNAISKRKLDRYRLALENTLNALLNRNLPTFFYDTHSPIAIDKSNFLKIMNQYDWNIKHGYVVKSLYVNSLGTILQYL